ncbi:hypothetical protein D3C81_1215680 [compost metagenome]
MLQLGVHIYYLRFHYVDIAQPLAIFITRERLRNTGFKRFNYAIEVYTELAGKFLHFLLGRRLLEHFFHFIEQAIGQIGCHFFNRQHGRRRPDNVVLVVSRIGLVHLSDIRTDVANIVVNGEFLAGLLLFISHEVRNVLRRYVHAVIISVLQQLALRIGCRNQMAQVKRRQWRIDVQNVAVLLTESLATIIHVHPIIQLFQRSITILFNVLAGMLA